MHTHEPASVGGEHGQQAGCTTHCAHEEAASRSPEGELAEPE